MEEEPALDNIYSMPLKLFRLFTLTFIFIFCFAPFCISAQDNSNQEEIDQKEKEISDIQDQIKQYRKSMNQKDLEISSLESEVKMLESNLLETQKEIETTQNKIVNLDVEISEKTLNLEIIESDIQKNKDLIIYYLQAIYEKDQKSLMEILFSQEKISQFFNEMNSTFLVEEKLKESLEELNATKARIDLEKNLLEKNKLDKEQYFELQAIQKSRLSNQKIQKETAIFEKENQNAMYEKLVQDAESTKKELEENIYRLQIGNITHDFTLDDAFSVAQTVGNFTNVRPAFLLAILKQESNFGKNTGTSHYLDALTCFGKYSQDDPWVSQNIKDFLSITHELNLDPDATLVSACPGYGTGGAMGPAQFMPSTWMGYRDEVAEITKNNPPNPWNLFDAMTAMGLKLAKGGASQQTYESEFNAALLYFSGSINHHYDWYAQSVLDLAKQYEDKLKN